MRALRADFRASALIIAVLVNQQMATDGMPMTTLKTMTDKDFAPIPDAATLTGK